MITITAGAWLFALVFALAAFGFERIVQWIVHTVVVARDRRHASRALRASALEFAPVSELDRQGLERVQQALKLGVSTVDVERFVRDTTAAEERAALFRTVVE